MIKRLLIANRGEIACRIMRTAQNMGIHTIAVYSDADAHARHVREADEAHHVGGAAATDSYLRMDRILAVAKSTEADAIHPGYGFLSENADFAEQVGEAGIKFVGPAPSAIRAMGLKDRAKKIMQDAGVPVVPGYHGDNQTADFLKRKAYEIGYPVLIKAVAGGGGKGMRKVSRALEFDDALEAARREALAAFGNDDVLIERFVESPRHIEIQVFGDSQGNVVHLFERDCSLQRRHQKVIEEAPAPGMTEAVRAAMGKAACDAARAVNYEGAGTVEFIVDGSNGLSEDGFFFMEMNTRLQVEHPVTEAITGVDLVEWQLRVAAGEALPMAQEDLSINGHAMEARLYAEDPSKGFLPSSGPLHTFDLEWESNYFLPDGETEGIRVDSGVTQGDVISPHYDPMIAKVIAHGSDRMTAMEDLSAALSTANVMGLATNVPFLQALLAQEDFRAERFDTGLIDRMGEDFTARPEPSTAIKALAMEHLLGLEEEEGLFVGDDPFDATDGFQLVGTREMAHQIEIDGVLEDIRVRFGPHGLQMQGEDGTLNQAAKRDEGVFLDDSGARPVLYLQNDGHHYRFSLPTYSLIEDEKSGGDGTIRVPMHGKVIAVTVADGDMVEEGDILFSVEAMKMEHAVIAPFDGQITGLAIAAGDQATDGQVALIVQSREDVA
ncbi:MAG: acetyl-CoA carboxylase biotin carboxylase subunit [Pseudomonadota bacterium]